MSQETSRDPRRRREPNTEWDLPGPDGTLGKRSNSFSELENCRSRSPKNNTYSVVDDFIHIETSTLPDPRLQLEHSNQSYGSSYRAPHSSKDNGPLPPEPQSAPPNMQSRNEMSRPPRLTRPHSNDSSSNNKVAVKFSDQATLEGYKKKAIKYKMVMSELKHRRLEIHSVATRPPSPETINLLKENKRQQTDIHEKLMAITGMVDMLMVKESTIQPNESPDQNRDSNSPPLNKKFNYVYYDPEMHWCRVCNEFPPTAKDYLAHLHSPSHHKMAAQHAEAPWQYERGLNEGFPSFVNAPTKRTPIKGLQFFVPSTAWYCKLCSQFIGDWFCASSHLKSIKHSKNYNRFVEQNPSWETDWMSDRQKAFEKCRGGSAAPRPPRPPPDKTSCSVQYTAHTVTISKDIHTEQKSPSPPPDVKKKSHKKKKRRNDSSVSSNSSMSSNSDSTREVKSKRKKMKETEALALEDLGVMSNMQDSLSDSDRRLLDSLRKRHEKGRDERSRSTSRDRERISEQLRKIRESERRCFRSLSQRDEGSRGERRSASRERREGSAGRERREGSAGRERREGSAGRERRAARAGTRERRGERPQNRNRRSDSRDRREDSRDRQSENRDRRSENRDRRSENRDRRSEHRDRRHENRLEESLVAEFHAQLERHQQQQPPPALALPTALALPAALPPLPPGRPPLPPPVNSQQVIPPSPLIPPQLVPPPVIPPPVVMPPSQASILSAGTPAGLKDFQKALDIIFPTDPKKCAEMLEAMQQPGLLGAAPALGVPFGPYMAPPGMFGFDFGAGMYPPPLFDPSVPMLPPVRPPNPRHNRGATHKRVPKPMDRPNTNNYQDSDDLSMLGIDASDVGAKTTL